MRALMTTTGHAGHLLPLLPFAHALTRAGHDVSVASQRSRAAFIRSTGLAFRPFDDPPERESGPVMATVPALSPEAANARVIGEVFARISTRAALPGVLEIVETWRPDVIVRESYEFASCLAAERHGIAHVRVALGLACAEDEVLALAAPAVNELGVELGLATDPDGARIRSSPYLTLIPSALEHPSVPGPPWAGRFRDSRTSVAAALPDWWPESAGPLVYLTFGSVAGSLSFFPGLYRAAIDALADLPIRVLVTIGEAGDLAELGPLPANVQVERWVSQADVARHAAAVVCHGGYGTTLGALVHGLPLVVVPLFAGDQWHNARRVAQLGAGIALRENADRRGIFDDPGPAVVAAIRDAVRSVLDDPGYRRTARNIAGAIDDLPPVDAAVDLLWAVANPKWTDVARAAVS